MHTAGKQHWQSVHRAGRCLYSSVNSDLQQKQCNLCAVDWTKAPQIPNINPWNLQMLPYSEKVPFQTQLSILKWEDHSGLCWWAPGDSTRILTRQAAHGRGKILLGAMAAQAEDAAASWSWKRQGRNSSLKPAGKAWSCDALVLTQWKSFWTSDLQTVKE